MTRVLVLGSNGMLGSMVLDYLRRNQALRVVGTTRETFDAEAFVLGHVQAQDLGFDFVANCIGIIKPFCRDDNPAGVRRAIAVNALFPHVLGAAARPRGARVIQIATDCVYSGSRGLSDESTPHDPLDVYGKSKSLGEVFDGSLLNIRCSIIGPELKNRVSLLEWFLENRDGSEVTGFAHHRWNGVTTLQYARLLESIILSKGLYERLLATSHVHHFVPNTVVTKAELLGLMNEAFNRKIAVRPVTDVGPPIDRTISTRFGLLGAVFPSNDMGDAIEDLAHFMRTATAQP